MPHDVLVSESGVHLSKDEKVLMVQEYSGSNDSLVFYGTVNCKELRRLDISGARCYLRHCRKVACIRCSAWRSAPSG